MATAPSFRTFNRRLRRGLRAAEREEAALQQVYQSILAKALRGAQAAVRAMSDEIAAGAKFNPPDPDEMIPRDSMADAVRRRTRAPRERAAKAVVQAAAPGIAWDVGGVFSERLARMAGVRATMLNTMARETVAGIIAQALEGGWTVPETAAAIGAAIEEAGPAISTMLARTDLVGTQNGASIEAARLVYPEQRVMKTWLATADERTRETHADADGQSVPLDQTFSVGDAQLDYPGDPDGPDEEVCNCRCTVVYEDALVAEATASADQFLEDFTRHVVALRVTPEQFANIRVIDLRTGEAVPMVSGPAFTIGGDMSATETADAPAATSNAWKATLAVEEIWTEDGRFLVAGSTRWRDLPLTMSAMVETTEGGHLGAEVAGRIDTIERVGNSLEATGEFDGGEYGQEIKRMVSERTLRGVSVDLAILDYELRNMDTGEVMDEEEAIDAYFAGEPVGFAVLDSVIGMATICPFQAIEEATIEVVASAAGGPMILRVTMAFDPYGADEITAAAAGLVPLHPPKAWFDAPEFGEVTPFTITDEGQVYGHLAVWGECHIGVDHACITPRPSPSKYAHYRLGSCLTAEGESVPTGVLTMDTGHAPLGMGLTPKQVVAHYDNTGLVVADVVAGEDGFGPWVAGALRPDVPAVKVRALRAARMSGDWRRYPGGTDLAAILMVNVGGYEVPRPQIALVASAAGTDMDGVEMVAAGMLTPEAEIEQLASDIVNGEIDREIERIASSV